MPTLEKIGINATQNDLQALFSGLPTLTGYTEYKPETVGKETGLRREWRIIANTGKLRGLCWRERNANRKAVRYVGKRNKAEFGRYDSSYEEWRRAKITTVGNVVDGSGNTVGKG